MYRIYNSFKNYLGYRSWLLLLLLQKTKYSIMTHNHQNKLINESSPYLLQHAHNPVNWYPWGEEALNKAREENKLILVSVGYSACHWCHVMERESFEKEEVAEIMNEYFVCIKVDREERPDVDQIYMNAVHLMRGQGGWPLNCFAMPDGRPVFGGTYFPKNQWIETLNTLHHSYLENPQKFEDYAQNLLNGISKSEVIVQEKKSDLFTEKDIHEIQKNIAKSFDMTEGGFGGAPKFPFPIGLEFLQAYAQVYGDDKSKNFVELTLDKMAMGGIYDQIGGGFARYSVDKIWLVPHFEKMLYDNGQLVSLYAKAYQINPKPLYRRTIQQSLEFIERELTNDEGGFYAALDADSEGVEGKFYVWTLQEINQLLGNHAKLYCEAYDILEDGNWEGNNIPNRKKPLAKLAQEFQLSEEEIVLELEQANKRLLEERAKRVRPGLDDKVLTSWNALMLSGYLDAFAALGNEKYLRIAEKNATFIFGKLGDQKGKLYRTYKNGLAKINAFLDDYALFLKSLVQLYQLTFNKKYLDWSEMILQYTLAKFFDGTSSMFYYTEKDEMLVARKMELSDNVIPAANSVMAHNLMDMGLIFSNNEWLQLSRKMLINLQNQLKRGQIYYTNWDLLVLRHLQSAKEVVIMGEASLKRSIELQKNWKFNVVYLGSEKEAYLEAMQNRYMEGETMIYVCENKSCQLPVNKVEDALNLF